MRAAWIGSGLTWLALAGGVHAQQEMQPQAPCASWATGLEDSSCERVWVQGDYLLWWVSEAPVSAPLITTGPAASQGALGQPGVQVLYGGSSVGFGAIPGLRLSGGTWLDDDRQLGVEASAFLLERTGTGVALHSDANGSPLLATPFFRVGADGVGETTLRSSSPGLFVGGTGVSLSTRLWGAELNGAGRAASDSPIHLLVGFRSVSLEEGLDRVTNNETLTAVRTDRYGTQNHFYGGQVGARAAWQRDRLDLDLVGKLALGCTQETVSFNGDLSRPDGSLLPGGILIGNNRIGTHSLERFAVVPELRVQAGYALLNNLRGFIGYNVLYVSSVARPGEQIDRVVDTATIPSTTRFTPGPVPPSPPVSVHSTDFWAHGLNFGLELRF